MRLEEVLGSNPECNRCKVRTPLEELNHVLVCESCTDSFEKVLEEPTQPLRELEEGEYEEIMRHNNQYCQG